MRAGSSAVLCIAFCAQFAVIAHLAQAAAPEKNASSTRRTRKSVVLIMAIPSLSPRNTFQCGSHDHRKTLVKLSDFEHWNRIAQARTEARSAATRASRIAVLL